MSCRTTYAGSAFTTYARLVVGRGMSDVATLSTFHGLRSAHQGRSEAERRTYTDEQYRELLTRQMDRVRSANDLSEARRESILERLSQAYADPSTPDQATLYALFNLTPTIRDRANARQRFLTGVARDLGITYTEAEEQFNELESGIERSRGAGNPETYTEENLAGVRAAGLAREAGTVHAFVTLNQRVRRRQADAALEGPQRIFRTPVVNEQSYEGFTVIEHGYDQRNQRLEVMVREDATGELSTHAYRGFSAGDYQRDFQLASGFHASGVWRNVLRGNSSYAYANQIEADLDSAAPRCGVCGQFANNLHSCPQIGTPRQLRHHTTTSRWSRQQVETVNASNQIQTTSVSLPAIREFREAFQQGPVNIALSESFNGYSPSGNYEWANLRGNVTVYRNPDEDNAIQFNTSELRCTCAEYRENDYHCRHVDGVTRAIRERLNPTPRDPARARTPEERAAALAEAQRLAEAAASSDWTRNEETLAEARRTWRDQAEVTYGDNPDEFAVVYEAAIGARFANNNTPTIPYMRENALDGMAQRGSGQAFGMEIEYEFPPSMGYGEREAAQRAIGRELFEAGLAGSDRQQGYGASKHRGFRDTHLDPVTGQSNWSWERDGSVNGGELVSPGMYDEPETWERLDKAVEILRRNGAIPSKRAGAHVHVGTSMYNGDPAKYTELARMMTQHEDVMFRLAADPERGTHRNSTYASPLYDVPPEGFSTIATARNWQNGRTRILNFGGVTEHEPGKDHPEFRIFDSTLNSGAMQAQIKLAVAMTHAAARNAEAGGTARTKEVVGTHATRVKVRGRRRPTAAEIAEETATFRSLLDTLYRRKADKDQMISLFAQTKWLAKPATVVTGVPSNFRQVPASPAVPRI